MADELIDPYDEEGGESGPERRDWRSMAAAIGVIVSILSIIGITILLFTPIGAHTDGIDSMALLAAGQPFIKHAWWLSDHEIAYDVPQKGVNIYNTLTRNVTRVADSLFTTHSLNEFHISYSGNLRYIAQRISHSETSKEPDRVTFSVIIYDKSNGLKYPVGVASKRSEEILAFKWCQHGPAYAFVLRHHVYYVASPELPAILITDVDETGFIHGHFDWVYFEEIYAREQGAIWFSPSDKFLAYASHPEKSSKEYLMTTYSRGDAYDFNYPMQYPKTGEKRLAVYTVSIWSTEKKEARTMDVRLRDSAVFHYLFGVSWVTLHGKELLLATWANRWQNETALTLCSYEKATCSLLYEHKYEHAQWASPSDYESIVHSNSSIFFLLPRPRAGNAWQHIARIQITPDLRLDSLSFVPSGEYDVKRVVDYRPKEDVVFYEAQAPAPWNRHVYGAPAGNASVLSADLCLTCLYANCTYQSKASVSPGDEIKIDFSCLGPAPFYQGMIWLNSTLGHREMPIPDIFSPIPPPEPPVALPEWKTEIVNLSSGYQALVQTFVPPKMETAPVILEVYGGPDFNQVSDKFDPSPRTGYQHAIVRIDVRGSGGRGWKYRSPVYGRLATVEVEDTLEAFQKVLAENSKLDKQRVGVYGWSYGGTMAARLVELAPSGLFKCAVAGAPVTNFIYYDATYTERFMGDAPPSAFTDLSRDVAAFAHTQFLLVHGLRDDNVHFQNSALLIEALQHAAIPFQLMVYPNQGHSIGRSSGDHLTQLLNTFLNTCLTS